MPEQPDGTVFRYRAVAESSQPIALVIDNDQAILDMFTDVLGTGSWNCVTAESGPIALEHLQQSRFDLIFLDLMMPVMNGAATFREIRKLDQDVPVVIITGYPDSDLMSEALQTGPFAVMKKPFLLNDLRWMLNHSVQRSKDAVS